MQQVNIQLQEESENGNLLITYFAYWCIITNYTQFGV